MVYLFKIYNKDKQIKDLVKFSYRQNLRGSSETIRDTFILF